MVEELLTSCGDVVEICLAKLEELAVRKIGRHFGLLLFAEPFDHFLNALFFILCHIVPAKEHFPRVVVFFYVDFLPALWSQTVRV